MKHLHARFMSALGYRVEYYNHVWDAHFEAMPARAPSNWRLQGRLVSWRIRPQYTPEQEQIQSALETMLAQWVVSRETGVPLEYS